MKQDICDYPVINRLQPITAFTIFRYKNTNINERITYKQCLLLINSFEPEFIAPNGIKYWNINQILSQAILYPQDQLLKRIYAQSLHSNVYHSVAKQLKNPHVRHERIQNLIFLNS